MRDIIRCGLAMIVCFLALAGLYVILGAPMVAAAQVIVYIGAISVLILFAIMLTQDKAAPGRLVFQTQAVPAAIAAIVVAVARRARRRGHGLGRGRRARSGSRPTPWRTSCSSEYVLAVRGRQRAAARRRDRRRVPGQARAGRPDRERPAQRLPDAVRGAVRDRDVRLPRPAQRDLHADVDRADAQRGQPRRSSPSARSSRRSGRRARSSR